MSAGNTIIMNKVGPLREKEGIAAGTIKPGHLITETVAEVEPNPPTVNVHATQGVHCVLQIAIEDSLQGKGIDTDYVTGDIVRSFVPRPGDRFQCYLYTSEVGVYGARLVSKGDGTFEIAATTEDALAICRSTLTPSGSPGLIVAEAL